MSGSGIKPHDLRHGHGGPRATIAKKLGALLLGHARTDTIQIYTRIRPLAPRVHAHAQRGCQLRLPPRPRAAQRLAPRYHLPLGALSPWAIE